MKNSARMSQQWLSRALIQVLRNTLGKARRQVSEASTMDPLSHRWHKAKGSSKKVECILQGGITEPFRATSEPPNNQLEPTRNA